jgi:hypothetical protein
MWIRFHTLTAVLILLIAAVSRADAQNIVYGTLAASLDDGSLAGTTFQVTFSYDADQVAQVGESYVELESFDFTLLGTTFSRDWIFQGGQAIFQDGVIQNVTASFQVFMPPDSPVNNITFGFGGDGMIGYIDLDGQFGSGSFTFEITYRLFLTSSPVREISIGSLGLMPHKIRADLTPL